MRRAVRGNGPVATPAPRPGPTQQGDPREPRSCCETIETLSNRVRMRWPAVLEGEHIVAVVVVASEELALAVLDHAPAA